MTKILVPATAGLSLLMATSALSATCTDSVFNLISVDATETCSVEFDGARVVIAPGVSVVDDVAVDLKSSSPALVRNFGTLRGLDGDAVKAKGDDVRVINRGRIIGSDEGVQGENGLTIVNSGLIRAEDKGIDTEGFDNLTVRNWGRIVADDKAIRAGDDDGAGGTGLRVMNAGRIVSKSDEGIETGDDATILNFGRIAAFDDAIQVGEGAYILNAGRIVNTQTEQDVIDAELAGDDDFEAQDAIDIDSGTIVNLASGLIRSTTNAAIDFDPGAADSTIYNYGRIRGTVAVGVDEKDTAGQHVINHGVLIGTSGTALDLGLGDDSLEMHAGARMRGGADFGAGDDGLSLFDGLVGMIGGVGAILDGGDDFDTVSFIGLTLGDIVSASFVDDVLNLGFGEFGVALTNWEYFSFGKDGYTTKELVATVAPVPLPASVALMIPALGLLGWAGRRRRNG